MFKSLNSFCQTNPKTSDHQIAATQTSKKSPSNHKPQRKTKESFRISSFFSVPAKIIDIAYQLRSASSFPKRPTLTSGKVHLSRGEQQQGKSFDPSPECAKVVFVCQPPFMDETGLRVKWFRVRLRSRDTVCKVGKVRFELVWDVLELIRIFWVGFVNILMI